jgi:Ni,Fe-hydrogenase III large subunit/Ni,Fe-hydrogenase III component G
MMDDETASDARGSTNIVDLCNGRWNGRAVAALDSAVQVCRIACGVQYLRDVCAWLAEGIGYVFATLIVEESPSQGWSLTYVFYNGAGLPWVYLELQLDAHAITMPSIVGLVHGPSVDWHEREAEDLFGLRFEGHPRLGEFVLHEDWPEGVNPMRRSFDARRRPELREPDPSWKPPTIVSAPGSFAMPVGPVFADFAEAAHFLLETVGEDVIHTIPRFFYKYRGVEKIAEGKPVDRVLLLAERFSGTAAFAHGLGFCRAVETVCGIEVPPRASALRTVFAELERLRHHAATITGICNSTALAVATSQAALIEEELLRLSWEIARHRFFFGAVMPGGVACDLAEAQCRRLASAVGEVAERLGELHRMLRYSSSFLDRLEEVGVLSAEAAVSYGAVGPIARASGVDRDLRKLRPYAAYETVDFTVPVEQEGDGYARLRVFFREAEQSASIIGQILPRLPGGEIHAGHFDRRGGAALAALEAPSGAAFHWVRLHDDGTVARYRVTTPAFTNWHGFHLAAENFAFQDFPIILASFGLSNAECDR